MTLQEVFDQRVASFRPLLVEGFVSAVANDTLTERQLGIYLVQDIHYLEALAKNLYGLQAEFIDAHILEILGRHSSEALKTCSEMRRLIEEFPGLSTTASDPIRPTTYAYINHQRLCLEQGPRAGLWSLLPCYLFYPTFVREVIACKSERPFIRRWVESLPKYDGAILWKDEIEEIFLMVNVGPHDKGLERLFSISEHYEVMFLRMAYREESWLVRE